MLIRALVLSGPSEAWGWSLGSLFCWVLSVVRNLRLFVGMVMYVWISYFASGISLASSFSQSLLWKLRQTLPLVFHMAMICNSQECLESGICMLFQKGTFTYWTWFDGMVPRNLHKCGCLGICGRVMHRDLWSFYFQEGRSKTHCGCFLCVDGSRVYGVSWC